MRNDILYARYCILMSQVDQPADVADGSVPGVKNAAVRKLYHELGIPAEYLPMESFKFLTRLHYYAADAITHGPNSPWGEHEIDYILFIQVSFGANCPSLVSEITCPKMAIAAVIGSLSCLSRPHVISTEVETRYCDSIPYLEKACL